MIPANLISALFNINILVVIPPAIVTSSIIGSSTRLLVKTTGVDASANSTFLDSSANNLTVTRAGNATQGAFSPHSPSGWSTEFNGTSDSLALAANTVFDFGTGDFTVEVWVYNVPTPNSYPSFISSQAGWSIGASGHRFDNVGYANKFWMGLNGSAGVAGGDPFMVSTNTFNHNQWYHYAITRVGNTWRMFVDGVLQNTQTFSGAYNLALAGMRLGNSPWDGAGGYWSGSLSNLRITKGTALYTSDFIPSTSTLIAITGTGLLALQSNRFVDNSVNNLAITPAGTPKVIPTSPFVPTAQYSPALHGGSLYFDGTGDWLQAINTPLLNLTADFTIEFWSYLDNSAAFQLPVGANAGGEMMIAIGYPANSISIGQHNVAWNSTFTGHNIPSKVWTHIALARANSVLKCFVNGIQLGASSSNAVQYTSSGVRIGANENGYFVTGYLSNLRIVKGSAVYTANFVPPTAPLTTIAGTSLLLHGVNAGIYDASARRNIETVGTAQVSAAVKKYQSSVYLPGSTSYLSVADSSNQSLYSPLGDFTIEMWVRTSSALAYTALASSDNSAFTAGSWTLLFDSAGQVAFWASNFSAGAPVVTSGSVIVNNNRWNHVAIQRSASTFTLFINGITVGSATSAFTQALNPTNILIGAQFGYARNLIGYIEDVRMSAVALYRTSFTPTELKSSLMGDSFGSNVKLLIGTSSGAQINNNTFLDTSPLAHTITAVSDAAQGSFSPISSNGWSVEFDGTSHCSTTASNFVFPGDHTIECWLKLPGIGDFTLVDTTGNAGNSQISRIGGTLYYGYPTGITSAYVLPTNTWFHIAVSRQGNNLRMFIDGAKIAEVANFSATIGAAVPMRIGRRLDDYYALTGSIASLRIVNGSAVYTAAFTPPTTALTAIPDTVLLTMQDNRIVDTSISAHVLSVSGNPKIIPIAPFLATSDYDVSLNGGSLYCSGTGYITTPAATVLDIGTKNFCLEGWFYRSSTKSLATLFSFGSFNTGVMFRYDNLYYAGSSIGLSQHLPTFQWFHVAVVRNNGSLVVYVNGRAVHTAQFNASLTSQAEICIGTASHSKASEQFEGYIANFRATIDAPVYTTAFTPSTVSPTALAGTVLLLNFTNAVVFDAAGLSTVTEVNGTSKSAEVFKFTRSLFFNGTNNSLRVDRSASLYGTVDFTVDFWLRPVAFASGYRIVLDGEASGAFDFGINSTGTILYGRTNVAVDGNTTNAVTFGQWNHVVLRRANNTIQIFINGVRGLSAANSFDYVQSAVRIGAGIGGAQLNFNGYLEDFRMTAGKLRYTVEPKSAL